MTVPRGIVTPADVAGASLEAERRADHRSVAELSASLGHAGGLLETVMRVYIGSDVEATRSLYAQLEALGPAGAIAVRAQKNSARAKVYRGRGFRRAAYDRKQWSLDNVTGILAEHGAACGITWGWGVDQEQPVHSAVLYVDLPTGQVSFHAPARGAGPDYPGRWDGVRHASAGRICSWCARLLAGAGKSSPDAAA